MQNLISFYSKMQLNKIEDKWLEWTDENPADLIQ